MRYYIYDTEKGYEEFEDLKEASEKLSLLVDIQLLVLLRCSSG